MRANFPIGQSRSETIRRAERLGIKQQVVKFYFVGDNHERLTFEEANKRVDALPPDSPNRSIGTARTHSVNPMTFTVRERTVSSDDRRFSKLELCFDDSDALTRVTLTPTYPKAWEQNGFQLDYD